MDTTAAESLLPEDAPAFYDTNALAELLGRSRHTINWYRHKGIGPRGFTAPGGKRVLYARADVEAWMRAAYEGGVSAQ